MIGFETTKDEDDEDEEDEEEDPKTMSLEESPSSMRPISTRRPAFLRLTLTLLAEGSFFFFLAPFFASFAAD